LSFVLLDVLKEVGIQHRINKIICGYEKEVLL